MAAGHGVQAARQLRVERSTLEKPTETSANTTVDHEAAMRRALDNALGGPLVPVGVRLENVEQHIAVDEHAHPSVLAAREGHDRRWSS